MKPIQLTLQAFGSYGEKTVIDFTKATQNLFLITGDTGAGKSTIFDAIVFALYGEASSMKNKKDGKELQSQFASLDVEPYVELIFRENEEIYQVKRIPRHDRQKQRGQGVTNKNESVSLIMPDGSEYASKETNQKISEIVGLTKEQFMQIAMIAQGEFMDVLRAKTTDKKEIFRRLFGTEKYQKIVNELERRKKDKAVEMARLRTMCQTEAVHIRIPETYEKADRVSELKNAVTINEEYNIVYLEQLIAEMELLCEYIAKEKKEAEKKENKSAEIFNEKNAAYARAEGLLKQYDTLEASMQVLKECDFVREQIQEKEKLVVRIRAAYDIQAKYHFLEDKTKTLYEKKRELAALEENMPKLLEEYTKTEKLKEDAEKNKDIVTKEASRTKEKASLALSVFESIKSGEYKKEQLEMQKIEAEKKEQEAREERKLLDEQESLWKEQEQELSGVDVKLQICLGRRELLLSLKRDADNLSVIVSKIDGAKKKLAKAQETFVVISQNATKKTYEYEAARNAFLKNSAGVLARQLEEGKPCPVCGSITHPAPCIAMTETVVSKEELDRLEKLAGQEKEKENQAASQAQMIGSQLKSYEEQYMEAWEKIKARLMEQELETMLSGSMPQELELEMGLDGEDAIKEYLNEAEHTLDTSIAMLEEKSRKFVLLKKNLSQIAERKREMEERIEKIREKTNQVKEEYAKVLSTLATLRDSLPFSTEEEANRLLLQADRKMKETEKEYKTAFAAYERAKSEKENSEVLIATIQAEIPRLLQECDALSKEYQEICDSKNLSEAEWKDVTASYSKDTSNLEAEILEYQEKRSTSEALAKNAKEAIGEEAKPDLSVLLPECEEALQNKQNAAKYAEEYRQFAETNRMVRDNLKRMLEGRQDVLEEQARIESLYGRLNGKVSGARMDIETYAQRFYLEQILDAANERFYDMTLGQYELRMYNLDRAGEGKNHGLDLMVYSHVTGKEREVKMLSGGESFLAALSLALGMADQIQEKSSAVNLDIMFIDEGFGSLDDTSRKEAVTMLKKMAGGTKLIGLISHVTELRQEIEDHLEVKKTEQGSRVSWS